MSDIERGNFSGGRPTGARTPGGFVESLEEARDLLDAGEVEGALQLLERLEQDYVQGVEIFDLLGEALIKNGEPDRGARYKTLHKVLGGTFRISGEEQKGDQPQWGAGVGYRKPPLRGPVSGDGGGVESEPPRREIGVVGNQALFPVTVEMGRTFMRQMQFDRAVEIFDVLLEQRPDDESIRELRDQAEQRTKDKALLSVLQGWLGSIDKMRNESLR